MILWLRFRCGEIDGNLRWRVESCYMTNVILRHQADSFKLFAFRAGVLPKWDYGSVQLEMFL